MHGRSVAVSILALSVLAGCARPGGETSVRPAAEAARPIVQPHATDGMAWRPAPAAPGEVVYPDIGARTRPAPTSAAPVIASAVATKIALTQTPLNVSGTNAHAELRLVVNNDFVNSTLTTPRLEWVVTIPDAPVVIMGPHGDGPSPQSQPTYRCPLIAFVDAATGAGLGAFQACGPTH